MTLLESLVALVIVGLFAVGTLEGLQTSSRSTRSAADWVTAVALADEAMEEARILPGATGNDAARLPKGFAAVTERRPRENGMQEIVVTVTMPGGSRFSLRRLAAQ